MARRFRSHKEWQDIVEKWELSGLSAKEFCRQEGVGEGRFYEVRKKLKTGIKRQNGRKKTNVISQPLFIPVRVKQEDNFIVNNNPSNSVLLEVTLSNGHYLRFPSNVDMQTLITIAKALVDNIC